MKRSQGSLIAALVLALAPGAAFAADPAATQRPADPENRAGATIKSNKPATDQVGGRAEQAAAETTAEGGPPAADVLVKLHAANKVEIEAGKLAVEKGHSKATKEYGKTLVRDHTAADKKVQSLAKQMNIDISTADHGMKHEKLEHAKALSGPEFDRAFAEAMMEDHKKDVEEATEARDKTTNPKLKKLLTEIVPKLEKHRATAEKLAAAPTAAK